MNEEQNQSEGKKSYEPPRVTKINLRPEEAVLGHCKILGSGGPVALGGGICGVTCSSAGS